MSPYRLRSPVLQAVLFDGSYELGRAIIDAVTERRMEAYFEPGTPLIIGLPKHPELVRRYGLPPMQLAAGRWIVIEEDTFGLYDDDVFHQRFEATPLASSTSGTDADEIDDFLYWLREHTEVNDQFFEVRRFVRLYRASKAGQ